MKTPQILGAASLYLIPLAGFLARFRSAAGNPPAANLTRPRAPEIPAPEPMQQPTPDRPAAIAAQVRKELNQRESDQTPTPSPTNTRTRTHTPPIDAITFGKPEPTIQGPN